MFRRDIIDALSHWADSPRHKPLVLRGARQVGKTTAVNAFGATFENYVYVNMDDVKNVELFRRSTAIDDIIENLFAISNVMHKPGRTLLFFDEIQESPEAVHQLRYFYEMRPDVHVVAAGSLLENALDFRASFPVGRVEYMALRPCSFREFLVAVGKQSLRNRIEADACSSVALHSSLSSLFERYVLVGGMPEVVDVYAEGHDIVSLQSFYASLLQSYVDDVEKYSPNASQTQVIRHIINVGWQAAAKQISFSGFMGSSYQSREVSEAFQTLQKTMLLELVHPVEQAFLPMIPNQRRAPKLLWLDTGLVNYAAHIQKEVLQADDILDAWRGGVAEHVVAQELLSITEDVAAKRFFYSKSRSETEVDFVFLWGDLLIPIEVKTGHNAHLRSLHNYMDTAPHDLAVRVWSQPLQVDDIATPKGKAFRLISMPFYLVGYLPVLLQRFADTSRAPRL